MPVPEAGSEETPYGRYVTSDGWFVLTLEEALAVRNDEKGGAVYPLEAREAGRKGGEASHGGRSSGSASRGGSSAAHAKPGSQSHK